MTYKNLLLLCAFACSLGSAGAQLLNPGFEDWTVDSISARPSPDTWLKNHDYCHRIDKAQQGSYALGIGVWYFYVKTKAVQNASVLSRPAVLEGFYTYTDNIVRSLIANDTLSDTAFVFVYATKWNAAAGRADTIGRGQLSLFESRSYSRFSCPISYMSAGTPDSITVEFDPSIVRRYVDASYYMSIAQNGESSFLRIDNLSLQSPTGTDDNIQNDALHIYPNPASDYIHVVTGGVPGMLALKDLTGRTVARHEISGASSRLSLMELPAGMYLLSLTDKNHRVTALRKLIKL